jgi:regulator of protease activity HflC (stomatin/prohibitin superfamily)
MTEKQIKRPGKVKRWFKRIWYRHKLKIIISLLLFAFLLAYFWNNVFISIPAGSKGVMWKRFFCGTVLDKVYGEGLHIIWPWDKMAIYTLRIQERHETVKILTRAGLYVDIDISYRFYPHRDLNLPHLHVIWGPKYAEKFVSPEVKAAAIAILGNYTPDQLYTIKTSDIQDQIKGRLLDQFLKSHIMLHDVLITRLALPQAIKEAIEQKLTREQQLQEYDFRLEIEKKEKERKRIEALGVQLFEEISGIPILKWRGLEVTSEIARSQNTKVIIVGTGPGGLPIILNADQ